MSQSSPPTDAVARLPVLATVRQAYGIVLGEPGLLLRALAMPFLLSILIAGLAVSMPSHRLVSFTLAIANVVPYTIFGVAWCRLTLLGTGAGQPQLFPSWGARHWRYFGYHFAMVIIALALLMPPIIMGTLVVSAMTGGSNAGLVGAFLLVGIPAIIGTAYALARLCFVFPAAAADEIYGWRHSWVHTRGQGMRLLVVIALSMVPAIAVQMLGASILPEIDTALVRDGVSPEEVIKQYLADNAGLIAGVQVTMIAMSYLVLAVTISAVSVAFRVITGWVPASAPPLAKV